MYKMLIKLLSVLLYMTFLVLSAGISFWELLDVKGILLVIFGTAILSLASYKRGMSKRKIMQIASWNAMVAGYLTTFIFIFARMSGVINIETVLKEIVINFRPLLYAFILYLLLKGEGEDKKKETSNANEIPEKEVLLIEHLSQEQAHIILRMCGLTDREGEIAFLIKEGMTNREIGETLFISETTAKKHVQHIFEKLQLSNREQLKQWMKEKNI